MKTGKRAAFAIGALATLLPFGGGAAEARSVEPAVSVISTSTSIDGAIDAALKVQIAGGNLTEASAAIFREQLQIQFQSLSAAAQKKILAATTAATAPNGIVDVISMLRAASRADVEQVLADIKAEQTSAVPQGIQPKLGLSSPDRVFVGLPGPCRVTDSRNTAPLAAGTGRQIYALDTGLFAYSWASDQGGTGNSVTGNCIGSNFFGSATIPSAVVATVTVVNTTSTGALQAWNGGTTLSGGAVIVWNAGDRAANTTVIPLDRGITAYPGSGFKRDFAVYNNSFAQIDYVVDVIGYMIENTATALDCTTVTSAPFNIGANANLSGSAPACAAGFTRTSTSCFPSNYAVHLVGVSASTCYFQNTNAGAYTFTASSVCCRVPGR